MTVSAHFIKLRVCNIALYNSPAPLTLNSPCLCAPLTAPCARMYVQSERMWHCRVIALLIGVAERVANAWPTRRNDKIKQLNML